MHVFSLKKENICYVHYDNDNQFSLWRSLKSTVIDAHVLLWGEGRGRAPAVGIPAGHPALSLASRDHSLYFLLTIPILPTLFYCYESCTLIKDTLAILFYHKRLYF